MNETIMYESMPAVSELNHVEGFEPRALMRKIGDEENKQLYLDVLFRKLWFRLKNPNGKIGKKIVKLTDQCAVVEARIYLDKNDPEDNYVSNAFGLRFYNTDGEFGPKYLEMAETAAAGRALADAGFGSQFADVCGEQDPVQVDAGLSLEETESIEMPQTDGGILSAPISTPLAESVVSPIPPDAPSAKPIAYTMDMDMEKIMALMTMEDALNLTISAGAFKGKTLGSTAAEKPSCLSWFINGYKGPDNILRAAAKLLYDSAMKAAG